MKCFIALVVSNFLTLSIQTILSQYDCFNESSCIDRTLLYSTTSADINCYGYRSCEQISLIKSISSGKIYCYGSYSCHNVTTLEKNVFLSSSESTGYIYCRGLHSCSGIKNITTNNTRLDCDGSMSCANTNIYMKGTPSTQLRCNGFKSCADSYIQGTSRQYFEGCLSAANSIIESIPDSENSDVYYELIGFESGKNATIICHIGQRCVIWCYDNACDGLTMQCQDGSTTSCTLDTLCLSQVKSDQCPDGYDFDSVLNGVNGYDNNIHKKEFIDFEIPSLYNQSNSGNRFTTVKNSIEICKQDDTTMNSINCNDYQECNGETLDTTDSTIYPNGGPICCSGNLACWGSQITSSVTPDSESTAIRCDGYVNYILYSWLCFVFFKLNCMCTLLLLL